MENQEEKPQIVTEEIRPEPEPVQSPVNPPEKTPVAAFLGESNPKPSKSTPKKNLLWVLLFVLLLVVASGLVFFTWFANQNLNQSGGPLTPIPESTPQPTPEPTPSIDPMTADLEKTDPSDELEPIEEDLTGTNLDLLDQELAVIQNELENQE